MTLEITLGTVEMISFCMISIYIIVYHIVAANNAISR